MAALHESICYFDRPNRSEHDLSTLMGLMGEVECSNDTKCMIYLEMMAVAKEFVGGWHKFHEVCVRDDMKREILCPVCRRGAVVVAVPVSSASTDTSIGMFVSMH